MFDRKSDCYFMQHILEFFSQISNFEKLKKLQIYSLKFVVYIFSAACYCSFFNILLPITVLLTSGL